MNTRQHGQQQIKQDKDMRGCEVGGFGPDHALRTWKTSLGGVWEPGTDTRHDPNPTLTTKRIPIPESFRIQSNLFLSNHNRTDNETRVWCRMGRRGGGDGTRDTQSKANLNQTPNQAQQHQTSDIRQPSHTQPLQTHI